MHVCLFCHTTFESDYFKNVVVGLEKKGIRISLVELAPGTPPTWLAEVPDVLYLCLNAARKLSYPMAVWRLARFLRAQRVDILHAHLFDAGCLAVLSKALRRKTVVAIMRHHTGVVRMLGSGLHVAADKWMAEKADHVTTVSLAARRHMLEIDRIRRDDIDVIYTGFDFEKLSPSVDQRIRIRREFAFSENDFVIGYAANFINGKGHLQLIEAFRRVVAEVPNARLFMAGRGTLREVQNAAAQLAGGQVVFAGWRDDLTACLNAMDLFVQPSLSEAFSQVLVEAMGVGLPVIATRVGGADEVIRNGENGLLIEPGDAGAIYEQVVRLLNDETLRTTIAEAGMRSVRERFTVPLMVESHAALYERWMSDR